MAFIIEYIHPNINIKKRDYNFLFYYNQNEILLFIKFEIENSHSYSFLNDVNYNEKYPFNYSNKNNIFNDILEIYIFYKKIISIDKTINYITNYYIGKLKNGYYFSLKINNLIHQRIYDVELYVSENYYGIINNKSIYYSNDFVIYNRDNLLEIYNNTTFIKTKLLITEFILNEFISCSNFKFYLSDKIKKAFLEKASAKKLF